MGGVRIRRWQVGLITLTLLGVAIAVGASVSGRGRPAPTASAAGPCDLTPPQPGTNTDLGLVEDHHVAAPTWVAQVGYGTTVEGNQMYALTGNCLVDRNLSSGRVVWSAPAGAFGTVAGSGVLVTATTEPGGGQANTAWVDGLIVRSAATGRLLWRRRIPPAEQVVPVQIVGPIVVVAEANGAVLGLSTTTGRIEWSVRGPTGCTPGRGVEPGGFSDANLVRLSSSGRSSPVVIDWQCSNPLEHQAGQLARLDPATGRVEWRWHEPVGWSVEWWAPAGTDEGVLAVLATGPHPVAAVRVTYPGLAPGGGTYDAVAIDLATGHPLWQSDDVPYAGGIVGGGAICVTSQLLVDCRSARTGLEAWQYVPSVAPIASSLSDQTDCAYSMNGVLYDVTATRAAPGTGEASMNSTPEPGAFHLLAFSMRTGRQLEDRPLPAWDGSGNGGTLASVQSPPGVVGGHGTTLIVSPDLYESDVLEAFPAARPAR